MLRRTSVFAFLAVLFGITAGISTSLDGSPAHPMQRTSVGQPVSTAQDANVAVVSHAPLLRRTDLEQRHRSQGLDIAGTAPDAERRVALRGWSSRLSDADLPRFTTTSRFWERGPPAAHISLKSPPH